jgi:DNA ligase-associated metallophosphoesterase
VQDGSAALDWGGEAFAALGDRALWWGRRETLCVADLHLGKAAAFRAGGVPVPEMATSKDLSRLGVLIERFKARRLVILGDLIHAASGRANGTMDAVTAWRMRHREVDILLVRGNHDARAGDPPAEWRMRVMDGPWQDTGDDGIWFAHDPEEPRTLTPTPGQRAAHVLCGHLHPAVSLGRGMSQGMRSRCFWFRAKDRVGVLPAFGSFTGSTCVDVAAADRVIVVGGNGEVVDVSRPRGGL